MPPPPTGLDADARLRAELVAALRGGNARVATAAALDGIPAARVNEHVSGLPYSLWELVEHLRIAQADILSFVNDGADYKELKWPDEYWPHREGTEAEWHQSRAAFLAGLDAAVAMAEDTGHALTAELPHAPGYTRLRELLLIIDHNATHIGEIVVLRRLLGLWG